jgi:DNA-binding NtrC family response regulator
MAELAARLDGLGYDVEVASTDAQSLDDCWPAHEWNRVVICETDVADDAGLDLLIAIKERHAGIPVVVLSQTRDLRLTQRSLAWLHGAEALLFWPVNVEELEDVLRPAMLRLARWRTLLADASAATARQLAGA